MSWTAWSPFPGNCSSRPKFRPASGYWRETRPPTVIVIGVGRCSSSTPASSATWWTACAVNSAPTTSARSRDAYHRWRNEDHADAYADEPGFCKSATLAEVREHGHVLTPGRYVGAADAEDDGVPFAEKFEALRDQLQAQFSEGRLLEEEIASRLAGVSW